MPPPLNVSVAPPTVALSRGLPPSTTGVFACDVAALATMAACVPTLRLFRRKGRYADLVSAEGGEGAPPGPCTRRCSVQSCVSVDLGRGRGRDGGG